MFQAQVEPQALDERFEPGSEIAPSWSPIRPNIQFWRREFHSWSPAGDS